MTVIVQR